MPTQAPEQELIKIADLIVGLRDKLADKDEQIANLIAELDAMRRGVDAYRRAFVEDPAKNSTPVRQWEEAVGSIIWPRTFAAAVSQLQQPWREGDIQTALASVPGIEWEIERKSGDISTSAGFLPRTPEIRHRPANLTWEAVYKIAAPYLGKTHCLSGHPRLEDSQIAGWFAPEKEGPAIVNARVEYHRAYSQAVEFLRPAAVTVAATTKAANLCGDRREYLKPLYEAPESRPFRFVDILGRPISWTLLDPKMPTSGAEPKAAAAEASTVKPGAEYRQGLRPKIFEKLTDIIWDDQRTPRFASRPVNATWAEVQRRAAELMGREDCLAGRERLTTEGVYDAVGMTHEDRAKTDGAAVAYQKAYSDAVVRLRPEEVTAQASKEARTRGAIRWHEAPDPTSPFCYVDRNGGLPMSWGVLDPEIEIVSERKPGEVSPADGAVHKAGTIRGGVDALAVLLRIFVDGPKFHPSSEDGNHIETLEQDALIRLSQGKYVINALGKYVLAQELTHILSAFR